MHIRFGIGATSAEIPSSPPKITSKYLEVPSTTRLPRSAEHHICQFAKQERLNGFSLVANSAKSYCRCCSNNSILMPEHVLHNSAVGTAALALLLPHPSPSRKHSRRGRVNR